MTSPQTLSDADRRLLAGWAAACAERVLPLLEADDDTVGLVRDAVARAKAYGRGESTTAAEIRLRMVAVKAAGSATTPAGAAAARSAGQAAAVAHLAAHALGAAGYAAKAVGLARPGEHAAVEDEVRWQLAALSTQQRDALARLPRLGSVSSGPLGPGLLSRGVVGHVITELQAAVDLETAAEPGRREATLADGATLLLRPPRPGDEQQALAAEAELAPDGFAFALRPTGQSWLEYLEKVRRDRLGVDLAPGRVPATMTFALLDDVLVGRVHVRHVLTPHLLRVGGHIGYGVRPAFRRRGVATRLLRHGLDTLRERGEPRALVTCDDGNLASIRTIEGAGGVLEDVVTNDGVAKRRYWIDLTDPAHP